MKKLGMLAAAFFMVAGMSSCIKDYDCNCKSTASDGTVTESSTVVKGTKKTSETLCNELDSEVGSGEFKITTDCSI